MHSLRGERWRGGALSFHPAVRFDSRRVNLSRAPPFPLSLRAPPWAGLLDEPFPESKVARALFFQDRSPECETSPATRSHRAYSHSTTSFRSGLISALRTELLRCAVAFLPPVCVR